MSWRITGQSGSPIATRWRRKDSSAARFSARRSGALSALHRRLLFAAPRPLLELYDLRADPHELNNLAEQDGMQEIARRLRIELSNWMVREGDFLPIPSLTYPPHHSGLEKLSAESELSNAR